MVAEGAVAYDGARLALGALLFEHVCASGGSAPPGAKIVQEAMCPQEPGAYGLLTASLY